LKLHIVIFNGAWVFYHAVWLWSNPRFILLAGKKTRPPFLIDKSAATAVDRSPETAVGVHGFSVSPSWQFQSDKTGVFLTPDRHSFETYL
jgi:hypothetical protein